MLSSLLPEEKEERRSIVSFRISKNAAACHYNQHGRQRTNTADAAQRLPPQQLQSCVAIGMACQCGHAVHRVTKPGPQLHCQAAKSEPRSKGLKAVYSNVLKTFKSDGSSLKMVQKLMISSLLGLPMYRASRNFVILSLDGYSYHSSRNY